MSDSLNEQTEQSTFTDFSLRDLLFVVFRHKIKILLFFIIVVFVSFIFVFSQPDEYFSEATILVSPGRESMTVIPTTDDQKTFNVSRNPMEGLLVEVEIFKNQSNYAELVDRIGIKTFLGENSIILNGISEAESLRIRDNIASYLYNNIAVQTKRNTSNIINISYTSESPELSNKVVSEIINIYLRKRAQVHYSNSKDSNEFYDEQVKKTKADIEKIEGQLIEIKNRKNISSVENSRAVLSGRLTLIEQQKDQNNALIAESKSKIDFYKKELKKIPETIENVNSNDNEKNNSELSSLYQKEQELLSKYTEENILVKNVRKQIVETKNRLVNQSKNVETSNLSYQQLKDNLSAEQTNLTALEAKNRDLNNTLSSLKRDDINLNNDELEISRLERERDVLIENYNKYNSGLEETNIDKIVQQQNISNIKIIQPPTYPREPISSKKYRNLALGIFLGFFGGLGIAIISEYFDHSTKRPEDVVKYFKLKTLVSIPEDRKLKDSKKRIKNRQISV
jgi:uncharacterized protein involved in exopolysaccharide biosynthesis